MKMTSEDLIRFLLHRGVKHSVSSDGTVTIDDSCPFSHLPSKWTELPDNIHFNCMMDLGSTGIFRMPVFGVEIRRDLFIHATMLNKLPVLNVSRNFYMHDNIKIKNGTYVGGFFCSVKTRYSYLNGNLINGYFVESGLLS